MLSTPTKVPFASTAADRNAQKRDSLPWWSPAIFRDGSRLDNAVTHLSALVFDIEENRQTPHLTAPPNAKSLFDHAVVDGLTRYVHTTYSHNLPGKGHRYRLVLPFREPATVAQWRPLWRAWSEDLVSSGIPVDTTASNPARIFFAPVAFEGRADFEFLCFEDGDYVEFGQGPSAAQPQVRQPPPPPPPPQRQRQAQQQQRPVADMLDRAEAMAAPKAALDRIEEKCAFMRMAREDAGSLAEPEWYAWLGVLTRVVDGRDHAHAIGSQHAGYSAEETDERFNRQAQRGPATCDHIATLCGDCASCPYRTTTPVELGEPTGADRAAALLDERADLGEEAVDNLKQIAQDATLAFEELRTAYRKAEGVLEAARDAVDAAKARYQDQRRNADRGAAAQRGVERARDRYREAKKAFDRAKKKFDRAESQKLQATGRWYMPEEFMPLLSFRENGDLRPDGHNVHVVLQLAESRTEPRERLLDRFRYDRFTSRLTYMGEDVTSETVVKVRQEITHSFGFPDLKTQLVADELYAAAKLYRWIDSWEAEMAGLPRWDGVPRCDRLFIDLLGADDLPVHRLFGRWFMISMMVRGRPKASSTRAQSSVDAFANKVDTMPVLISNRQGTGKSKAVRLLAYRYDWGMDTDLDLGNKDSFMQIRGKWVVEMGEMVAISKKRDGEVKSYLSRSEDTYRAPYDRFAETHPRRCVFVGTTNREEIFLDQTGSRRFWPIRIGEIDEEWYDANYRQCLAEALVRAEAGERHYPWTDEEKRIVEQHEEYFRSSDAWVERLRVLLLQRGVGRVSLRTVLEDDLMLDATDRERDDPRNHERARMAFYRLGWKASSKDRDLMVAPVGFVETSREKEQYRRRFADPKTVLPEEAVRDAVVSRVRSTPGEPVHIPTLIEQLRSELQEGTEALNGRYVGEVLRDMGYRWMKKRMKKGDKPVRVWVPERK